MSNIISLDEIRKKQKKVSCMPTSKTKFFTSPISFEYHVPGVHHSLLLLMADCHGIVGDNEHKLNFSFNRTLDVLSHYYCKGKENLLKEYEVTFPVSQKIGLIANNPFLFNYYATKGLSNPDYVARKVVSQIVFPFMDHLSGKEYEPNFPSIQEIRKNAMQTHNKKLIDLLNSGYKRITIDVDKEFKDWKVFGIV